MTLVEKIRSRVTESDRGHGSLCWISDRSANPKGYTKLTVNGRTWYTHRLAYEVFIGPIPHGAELDHLCGVTACCNPSHLEPVDRRTNLVRSSAHWANVLRTGLCTRGHLMNSANVRLRRNGKRICRECDKERARKYRARAAA